MSVRIGYAGNRDIAIELLKFIIDDGITPLTLILPDDDNNPHSEELLKIVKNTPDDLIFKRLQLNDMDIVNRISELTLDYLICIHYPYIIPESILNSVNIGVLNLHPAYLPYNRGWHTPTWAILDNTPYGATLHFMDTSLDTGDIIHQKELEINIDDTAHSLYQRVLSLEIEVFKEAWQMIKTKNIPRISQKQLRGTTHIKSDIQSIQKIDMDQPITPKTLINVLRALTTNNIHEAAYFEDNENRYRVQISIIKDNME